MIIIIIIIINISLHFHVFQEHKILIGFVIVVK